MTLTKEDIDTRKKWAAALKSGLFKQGRCFLHYNDKYCCLGVASHIGIAKKEMGCEFVHPFAGYSEKDCDTFTHMNDLYRLTFEQIAQIIEFSCEPQNQKYPMWQIVNIWMESYNVPSHLDQS